MHIKVRSLTPEKRDASRTVMKVNIETGILWVSSYTGNLPVRQMLACSVVPIGQAHPKIDQVDPA